MARNDEPQLVDAFQASERAILLRCTHIGCILVLVLVPLGVSLDYFVYPQLMPITIPARVICDLIVLVIYLSLFTKEGQRQVLPLSATAAMAPAITICYMIYLSEGPMSPYYAGVNLVMIGICQLLPYTAWMAGGYCLTVLSCYLVACVLSPTKQFELGILFNNIYFITLAAMLCVTSCYIFTRRRFSDFKLRYELDLRNQQLTELDRQKSNFFANVSHELRTPLTLILAPVESLLMEDEQLRPDHRWTLITIRDNGLRLLQLIDDLLEVIRCEEGRVRLSCRPVRLHEFLMGLIDSARALIRQRGLRLEVVPGDETITVSGDPRRLEKVFLNLLTNAVKFTRSGGTITVRWWDADGKAMIEVADTGIGIADDDLPFIFDRFRQADGSLTRPYAGLGLGLALARELVMEHHGTLTVTSRPGEGSSFLVSLDVTADTANEVPPPAADAALAAPETESARLGEAQATHSLQSALNAVRAASSRTVPDSVTLTHRRGPSRILIVDDEPDMRRFLAMLLADEYQVLQAADGPSGRQIAAAEQPDLMIVDHMMPAMTGIELCRFMRESPELRHIKLLMLTARIDERARIEALEAGVDDFLTKPFSSVELTTRIRNLLRTSSLQSHLRRQNQELSDALERLKQTELQLVHSEKINALGTLAAGLLHEINNPLNYVMMATETLLQTMPGANDDVRDIVGDVTEGLQRIATIVADLRAFAYPQRSDLKVPFPIRDAVESALRFAAHELRDVHVNTTGINGEIALGSRDHIMHVLVNLLVNSSRAVQRERTQRSPHIELSASSDDSRVQVRVKDNGVGIPSDELPRIFEPFFTTQDIGHGMGLGLSICHTIVKNHGGSIRVVSEPGCGTEFEFDLPAWKGDGPC